MCQCQQLKLLVFQLCMMAILFSTKHCHALNRGCVFDAFCAYLLTVVSDGQKTFAFVLFMIPTLLCGLNVLNHHSSLDLGAFCKCISGIFMCIYAGLLLLLFIFPDKQLSALVGSKGSNVNLMRSGQIVYCMWPGI